VEHGNGWQQRSAGYCFDFFHPFLNGVQAVAGSNPVARDHENTRQPVELAMPISRTRKVMAAPFGHTLALPIRGILIDGGTSAK